LDCEFLQKKDYSYKIVRAHMFEYMNIEITLSYFTGTPRHCKNEESKEYSSSSVI